MKINYCKIGVPQWLRKVKNFKKKWSTFITAGDRRTRQLLREGETDCIVGIIHDLHVFRLGVSEALGFFYDGTTLSEMLDVLNERLNDHPDKGTPGKLG